MSTKTRKSNGEGTIYFSEKDGCWRAEITWFDGGGVRRRKCWGAKKQSEVKAKLNEFKKQLLKNGKDMTKLFYNFTSLVFMRGSLFLYNKKLTAPKDSQPILLIIQKNYFSERDIYITVRCKPLHCINFGLVCTFYLTTIILLAKSIIFSICLFTFPFFCAIINKKIF